MTEERLLELTEQGIYRRIGPTRHSGYVKKGEVEIYPYFGRYGIGWITDKHSNNRHVLDRYYYVRRVD